MKKLLIICLLCCASGWGTIITTSGNGTLGVEYTPGSLDTMRLSSGDTLYVDRWNAGQTDTTAYLLHAPTGTVIFLNGSRANFVGVKYEGGELNMTLGSDTLGIINGPGVGSWYSDFYIRGLGSSIININGGSSSTRAVIMGIYAGIDTATFTGSGLDDVTFTGTSRLTTGDSLSVLIDHNGTPDTYTWYKNGVKQDTLVPVTSTEVLKNTGFTANFGDTENHTIGDFWSYLIVADWPSFYMAINNNSPELHVSNAKFIRLESDAYSSASGVIIDEDFDGAENRFTWNNVLMDSCALAISNAGHTGLRFESCTTYVYFGMDMGALYVKGGNQDTIINNYFSYDYTSQAAGGFAGAGVTLNDCDSVIFDSNTIVGINFVDTDNKGMLGLHIAGGTYGASFRADSILGNWEFTMPVLGGGNAYGYIANCYFRGSGHEIINLHDNDSNWTFVRNVFNGANDGGRSLVLIRPRKAPGSVSCNNHKFYYNTFYADLEGEGGAPSPAVIGFENPNPNLSNPDSLMAFSGIEMVGNIFVGRNITLDSATLLLSGAVVTIDRFENNGISLSSGTFRVVDFSTLTIIDSSDGNTVVDDFGFIDFANGDFTLQAGSPMINAGEVPIWESLFGVDERGSSPGDAGANQFLGTGATVKLRKVLIGDTKVGVE